MVTRLENRVITDFNSSTSKGKGRIVRCLVTGFDSFGAYSSNPSQVIAESMPAVHQVPKTSISVEIDALVLPTCCGTSWKIVKKQLSKNRYDHLIYCGLAGKRPVISLERFALNIRDYAIPDNNGHKWRDMPIHKGEDEARRTTLPLEKLNKHLRSKEFPTEVSNYAGSFICNEVYYQGLRYKAETDDLNSVLFIHVPLIKSMREELVARKHPAMRELTSAVAQNKAAQRVMNECVLEVISYCAKQKV